MRERVALSFDESRKRLPQPSTWQTNCFSPCVCMCFRSDAASGNALPQPSSGQNCGWPSPLLALIEAANFGASSDTHLRTRITPPNVFCSTIRDSHFRGFFDAFSKASSTSSGRRSAPSSHGGHDSSGFRPSALATLSGSWSVVGRMLLSSASSAACCVRASSRATYVSWAGGTSPQDPKITARTLREPGHGCCGLFLPCYRESTLHLHHLKRPSACTMAAFAGPSTLPTAPYSSTFAQALSSELHEVESKAEFGASWSLGSLLGRGHSAKIYLCHGRDGSQAACKMARREPGLSWSRLSNTFEREAALLRRCAHPCIVQILGLYRGPQKLALVLSLAPSGDCQQLLQRHGALSERAANAIAQQTTAALDHLHTHARCLHRDVKLENVLVVETGGQAAANIKVVLCDLGHSCTMEPPHVGGASCDDGFRGTKGYVAPEVTNGLPWTTASDVWSLGVVYYALLANELLRWKSGAPDVSTKTSRAFSHVTPPCKMRIKALLLVEPSERLHLSLLNQMLLAAIPSPAPPTPTTAAAATAAAIAASQTFTVAPPDGMLDVTDPSVPEQTPPQESAMGGTGAAAMEEVQHLLVQRPPPLGAMAMRDSRKSDDGESSCYGEGHDAAPAELNDQLSYYQAEVWGSGGLRAAVVWVCAAMRIRSQRTYARLEVVVEVLGGSPHLAAPSPQCPLPRRHVGVLAGRFAYKYVEESISRLACGAQWWWWWRRRRVLARRRLRIGPPPPYALARRRPWSTAAVSAAAAGVHLAARLTGRASAWYARAARAGRAGRRFTSLRLTRRSRGDTHAEQRR